MARHIYIGTEGSQSYTNGALAAGGIDVQKISMGGPTSMAPGYYKLGWKIVFSSSKTQTHYNMWWYKYGSWNLLN